MKPANKKETKILRVLLAEDHEIVREGIAVLVNMESDMEVVGEASDGHTAIAKAQELQPDVIVMDVSMPGMNGLRATEKLMKYFPDIKVLALTRHTDVGFIQQLLRAGAKGYVLKQSPSSDLIRAIRIVAEGKKYLDPAITDKIVDIYAQPQNNPDINSLAKLTEREEEILKYIAWGYTNKEIAARLDISVKTVEVHKNNLMKKMGFASRIDIVRYALLKGWLQDN